MGSILIKNGQIVNEGQIQFGDLHIQDGRISQVGGIIDRQVDQEIDATGLMVMPGIIDDQVHFREPGLTYKADIASESRAALAGGTTSFMEMPNTKPPALTQALLQAKYDIAARTSSSNYSFFMGASNDNLDEVLQTNAKNVCGIKVFMGSSTGNMLVDDTEVLEKVFSQSPMLIATHCEDEETIRRNYERFSKIHGDYLAPKHHPEIRSAAGCLKSSSLAVKLARQFNTRLHILHISTADELALFRNDILLAEKRITAEVCVHHLYFSTASYERLGNRIKCNPAIKGPEHKRRLFEALLDNRLDIIATDHAPHTEEEKERHFKDAPSGLPLVQHSLPVMLGFYHRQEISLERIVEKMCHAPATCFRVKDRGYLREGYWADVVLVDINKEWKVQKENIFYKCGWSPFEGKPFKGQVKMSILNGEVAYSDGKFLTEPMGKRLAFY